MYKLNVFKNAFGYITFYFRFRNLDRSNKC